MRAALVLGLLFATAGVARAQYNVPAQASGGESRQQLQVATDGVTIAKPAEPTLGGELGASLDFLTSDPSLGGKSVKFTDVVLFRLHGLVAIGDRIELFAGADLLPKQPSYTNERVWQGALLGARVRIDRSFSAYARGELGPMLERRGSWLTAESAAQYRLDLAEKTLFWENTVGGTFTQLFYDPGGSVPAWQAELLTQTGLAIRDKQGLFATWLSFGFHFPLIARPSVGQPDPATGNALDPQTRVGVYFGMVLGVSHTLDLFIELSILDRGDLSDPRTTLPILSGGFDQKRILFGFNRRFGTRKH